ncbi:MAG TPA: histidine kinase [Burkholderiaceae bacterium]|nr:histidine kinase [Burkholderiaceae bacterium]
MGRGPSAEMRRFSAGIRVVTALMCTVLLLAGEQQTVPWPKLILVAYCAWSAWLLWVEATERSSRVNGVWPYWIDVAWSCLVLKVFSAGTAMMTVTLIHPVVLTSIGFGVTPGVTLALAAALGLLYAESTELTQLLTAGWRHTLPTLLVLTLVPAAAVVARPMSVLRHRLALIDELGAQLDPRRGLESICAELVEKLRIGTQADVVALVLPSKFGAPAMLASREDGSFRAKAEVHTNLEQRLAQVPSFPVSYVARHWWDPRRRVRSHGKQPLPRGLTAALAELARTLDVRSLHVVPLQRYTREHGHFVVGYGGVRSALQDVSALSGATAELLRIVEQAALVDQLQDESASHERARIGRDLHDSAIQPYLGLKYAVECVALRIPPDNPARAEVESLATLVNSEVSALRELISGLRTGCQQGDNALVPAVRRQARRFALLFGIEVEVECADHLPTTRALASALFHMVNEALNNVRKHTAAQHVRIGLAIDGARLRLVVRDDAGTVRGRPVNDFCPGSLSERAAELGGTLTVARHDGVNTELVIEVPL